MSHLSASQINELGLSIAEVIEIASLDEPTLKRFLWGLKKLLNIAGCGGEIQVKIMELIEKIARNTPHFQGERKPKKPLRYAILSNTMKENLEDKSDLSTARYAEAKQNILGILELLSKEQQLSLIQELAGANNLTIINEEQVPPDEVSEVLNEILAKQYPKTNRQPRRAPVRIQRILQAFDDNTLGDMTLSHLEKYFWETSNPRKNASNAMGWLGGVIEEICGDVELHSKRASDDKDADTIYQFRYRIKN